jgi:hypothetical protein
MADETSSDREEMINRLKEIVLDHLGLPRPGTAKHVQELQDWLLPRFIERSRHAWLAASPIPLPNDGSTWSYLVGQTQQAPMEVDRLNQILQDMGIHELLQDVADSPDVKAMSEVSVDPYEERILKAVGHPNPGPWMKHLLTAVSNNPSILSNTDQKLREANEATLNAHRNINLIINIPPGIAVPPPSAPAPEKPKRRKIFTGLGKLFSGLALLSGNAIVVPTVVMGVTALPVITSLAGGIAAVSDGIGQLLREGE